MCSPDRPIVLVGAQIFAINATGCPKCLMICGSQYHSGKCAAMRAQLSGIVAPGGWEGVEDRGMPEDSSPESAASSINTVSGGTSDG